MNLRDETLGMLQDNGLSPEDVSWVGSRDGQYVTSWQQFARMANKNYDAGYGAQEVIRDLVVVGKGWWLEREEYDGAEGWGFKQQPHMSETPKSLQHIFGGMWANAEELHG